MRHDRADDKCHPWPSAERQGPQRRFDHGVLRSGLSVTGEALAEIAQPLELDHPYVVQVEFWDVDRVRAPRSAGRKAGRTLAREAPHPSRATIGRALRWLTAEKLFGKCLP